MKETTFIQKVAHKSKGFMKKNSPTILTGIGAMGVVATSVVTAKAAIKASTILEEVEQVKGEELTAIEKVKIAGPIYIPAVLLGTATIVSIFGANALNKKKQATLIGAYTMLDSSFKQYKGKVKDLYGKEGHDQVIDEIVKEEADKAPTVYAPQEELFYDLYSGRYFVNTMENVLAAENEINKKMHTGYGDSGINELYSLLGLDPVEDFEDIGWNSIAMEEMYWHAWIEFSHRKILLEDGKECIILEFPLEPIVDYLEY